MWQILSRGPSNSRLQRVLSTFLILALTLNTQALDAKPGPRTVKVKRGQTLSLSLLTPTDSGHANVGDDVTLKLVRPLVADGATVLPAEWIVHGKVTKTKRAGKNCKDGQVVWELDRIKTPGGDQLKVQRVYAYPSNSASPGDPVWVPLDTPLTKIGGAAKFTGLLAVSIALSPLLIPLGIAATTRCEGRAGEEQSLPLGLGDLFAVSRDVRVEPLP
jgi:hypothetical protein